jgi:hypothetical protein
VAWRTELITRWGVADAVVLHDRPAARFVPTAPETRRALLERLHDALRLPALRRPPALLVSPSSWTEDEDFDVLIEAAERCDAAMANDAAVPDLLIVATGDGPLRERYAQAMAARALRRVHLRTIWLPADDYVLLVGAADLGLCFHRSTSGVDLPMKVADLLGAGVPVCALDYGPCLREVLRDGENGILFSGGADLAAHLLALFRGWPDEARMLVELAGTSPARRASAGRTPGGGARPCSYPGQSRARDAERRLLHPDLGFGGAERVVVDAATHLVGAGHRVVVLTAHHDPARAFPPTVDGTLDVRVRSAGIPPHVRHRLRAPCSVARMAWLALAATRLRERPDVVVCDLVPHAIPLVRLLRRIPVVLLPPSGPPPRDHRRRPLPCLSRADRPARGDRDRHGGSGHRQQPLHRRALSRSVPPSRPAGARRRLPRGGRPSLPRSPRGTGARARDASLPRPRRPAEEPRARDRGDRGAPRPDPAGAVRPPSARDRRRARAAGHARRPRIARAPARG